MKKIIALLLVCFLFGSCANKNKCVNSIREEFPDGDVYHIYETPYYLVIDSVGVYIVSCNTPFSYRVNTKRLVKKLNHENRN